MRLLLNPCTTIPFSIYSITMARAGVSRVREGLEWFCLAILHSIPTCNPTLMAGPRIGIVLSNHNRLKRVIVTPVSQPWRLSNTPSLCLVVACCIPPGGSALDVVTGQSLSQMFASQRRICNWVRHHYCYLYLKPHLLRLLILVYLFPL